MFARKRGDSRASPCAPASARSIVSGVTIPWRPFFALTAVLLSLPGQARGEQGQWRRLSTAGRSFELLPSSDPDEPALTMAFLGGRLEAMSGVNVLIAARRSRRMDFGLTLPAFIALLNFNEDNAMPWQTFRGSFGLGTLWNPLRFARQRLPEGGSFIFEIAYIHESDHAVDLDGYRATVLISPFVPFDNGNFSSYEYLKLRWRYQQRLAGGRVHLLGAVALRYFLPSINPGDRRELSFSISAEARGWVRVYRRLAVHLGLFYEVLANDFSSRRNGVRSSLEGDPLQTLLLETGLTVSSFQGRSVQLSFLYSRSHGRGLTFVELRSAVGFSLRIHL